MARSADTPASGAGDPTSDETSPSVDGGEGVPPESKGEAKHDYLRHGGFLLARAFRSVVPDPFVLAILLTAFTFLLAWAVEGTGGVALLDYWQGAEGFWRLLAFGMQMCLILMTGYALASAPPMMRALSWVAGRPRTGPQAIALTAFVAIALGLFNWGLGLCAGALMAREVGRSMARRRVPVHYPLLAAAGYASMMCWHGGLSGSAPLKVTGMTDLKETLGVELAGKVGVLPLSETILSPLNVMTSLGLLVLIPLFMSLFHSKNADRIQPISEFEVPEDRTMPEPDPPRNLVEWLEGRRRTTWLLLLPMFAYLTMYFSRFGLASLDLNTVILMFLALGLLLHGAPRHYLCACENAVRPCSSIMLQFPLYAGIMGIMAGSGLAVTISDLFARNSDATTLPFYTFVSAAFLNVFVPSGGGQWAIQGRIMMDAALQVGADPGRVVMAFAYGDQLTNAIQPFWALPLLAIVGVKARDVVGYMAVVMVVAITWIVACLMLF